MRPKVILIGVLAAAAFALSACGPDDGASGTATATAASGGGADAATGHDPCLIGTWKVDVQDMATQAAAKMTTANATVVYAGSDGGGVWKTTNCCSAATTWRVVTDFPEIASMSISRPPLSAFEPSSSSAPVPLRSTQRMPGRIAPGSSGCGRRCSSRIWRKTWRGTRDL